MVRNYYLQSQLTKEGLTAHKVCQSLSYLLPLPSYIGIGPCPMHEVVPMAVSAAVKMDITI